MAGGRRELSKDLRETIIKLHKEGQSLRKIGNIIGKNHSTVQKVVNRFKETGTVLNGQRTGRPKCFTAGDERIIVRKIKADPKLSAPKIAAMIPTEMQKECHPQTIRRVLYRHGYHNRSARKKPFISSVNKKKRLAFALQHINKDQHFWRRVIFSDESKFNIAGNDGRARVWRKPNTELQINNTVGTVKHGGGSVMVWGCMAESGVGNLVFIETKMDRFVFLNLLKNNLAESAQKLGLAASFIFQQDNDPTHTAKIVKEWLLYNTPKQLHTPPQSPDINPIEHLWEELERRIRKHSIRTKDELKHAFKIEWEKISSQVTKNLVESMPRRMAAVIKSKGYATKY